MKIKEMEHYHFLTKLFDFSQQRVQDAGFFAAIVGGWISVLTILCDNFFGISVFVFMALMVIMVTDYITGLSASKKEGKKFCSKRGLGWVFKLGSYMVFLTVSFSLQNEIGNKEGLEFMRWPMQLIHFYILIHIFLWETQSVDENFERLGFSFRILKLINSILNITKTKVKAKIDKDGK